MHPTTLYLIRHGATIDSDTRRYRGSTDVPLSSHGAGQVEETAVFLAAIFAHVDHRPLRAVYCSDLVRARVSAEIIAAPHALAPKVIPEFRERDFGQWEGLTFDEIVTKFPAEFGRWQADPVGFRPAGGESARDLRVRLVSTFFQIIEAHAGETIAIVAHGGVNRIILAELLGLPLEHIFRLSQDYAALSLLEIWDGFPVLKYLNFVPGSMR